MTKYLLPPDDAQKILNYLVKQPWIEVYQLIPILHNLETAPEQEIDNGESIHD